MNSNNSSYYNELFKQQIEKIVAETTKEYRKTIKNQENSIELLKELCLEIGKMGENKETIINNYKEEDIIFFLQKIDLFKLYDVMKKAVYLIYQSENKSYQNIIYQLYQNSGKVKKSGSDDPFETRFTKEAIEIMKNIIMN